MCSQLEILCISLPQRVAWYEVWWYIRSKSCNRIGQIHTLECFQKQEFAEQRALNMHLMLPSHEKLIFFFPPSPL